MAKASEWFHPEGARGLWTPVPLCLGKRQDSNLRPSQYMAVPYALTIELLFRFVENLGNFTAAKVSLLFIYLVNSE